MASALRAALDTYTMQCSPTVLPAHTSSILARLASRQPDANLLRAVLEHEDATIQGINQSPSQHHFAVIRLLSDRPVSDRDGCNWLRECQCGAGSPAVAALQTHPRLDCVQVGLSVGVPL